MTTATAKTTIPTGLDARVFARIAEEGYGTGAWHGADLKAAIEPVSSALAFWRPSPARHNIAEIALHHAYCARDVRRRLSGVTPDPFVLEGDDWFALPDPSRLTWAQIREAVEAEQRHLNDALSPTAPRRGSETLSEAERFDLVLGITCHAVYHAGQIQLLKALADESGVSAT